MSAQLIELIIFAAIAFFIINKLISTLGSTNSEEESKKGKSLFGNIESMKDVTGTVADSKAAIKSRFIKKKNLNLENIAVTGQEAELEQSLKQLWQKMPNFAPDSFLKKAKLAFTMIINAKAKQEQKTIETLVDKRYVQHFNQSATDYGEVANSKSLQAYISEIYLFGNNVFVKILFTGQNVTNKIKNLHEEWSFTKTLLDNSSTWYLTNIDRPH